VARQDASTGQIIGDTASDELAPGTMRVKVYSPFQNYFDQVATSVSAVNGTGPFDILAGHHNFMSLLTPCTIVIRREGGEELKLKITRGVMHVKSDRVVVFLDV
jgi:F0F1-type ATP synthase epsilon subunit